MGDLFKINKKKELGGEGKRLSKTQEECLLMQAQGRAPLAPVSPLWVVGYFAYLLSAKMCVSLKPSNFVRTPLPFRNFFLDKSLR